MNSKLNRRDFFRKGSQLGIGGCLLLSGSQLFAGNLMQNGQGSNTIIEPKKLNYCGYRCSQNCKMLKASVENDIELKKEAFREFKIKEKFGVDFDAEKIFCFGCKVTDKPLGINIKGCEVRNCAIEKGFDACVECKTLTNCEKTLWTDFPKFKEKVIEMQKNYFSSLPTN